jgi:phosphatidylglycerol:prolipoprotein diacylglycerol transferase
MDPVAFRIGPLAVHWYGLLIVIGAVLAAVVATYEARRRGEDPEHVWNVLTYCLILGIIGARLYHVFSTPEGGFVGWDYYKEHPIEIIAFWRGGFRGLGIYGAVIGGVVAVVLYTHFAKLSLLRWLDIPAPGLLLAQVIGRLGNFINQELYGQPTTLPWGVTIDCLHRYGEFTCDKLPETTRFHPTYFYEALWNIVGFALLLWLGRKLRHKLRDGDIFFAYLIWYPLGRFWVEMFRPDAWLVGGSKLATAQLIALVSIVFGAVMIFLRHRGWSPEAEAEKLAAEAKLAEEAAAETVEAAAEDVIEETLEDSEPEGLDAGEGTEP